MGDESETGLEQPIAVPSPPRGIPPVGEAAGGRRWTTVVGIVVPVLLAVAIVAGALIHVPYVIISPGQATALDRQVVSIEGAPTYEHRGKFLYLTVRVSNADPNLYRYLFAKLDGDVTVEKRETVIGCATYPESLRLSTEQMGQSQDVAKTAALRQLGRTVTDVSSRVIVQQVVCDGPARGHLQLGDVITAVEGTTIERADQLRPALTGFQPGQRVHLTVDRDGSREVTMRLGVVRHEGTALQTCAPVGRGDGDGGVVGTACIGVLIGNDVRHQFPFQVEIDTARVSGPSAGLAFSLALVDDLSPGELTGGRAVAVTGTIDADGHVGPVGGVRQKTITARRNGAALMLVPRAELREARRAAGSMRVVGVDTLAEAIAALERGGGDPVTTTSTTRP